MRKKRQPESDQQRSERVANNAQERREDVATEDLALDTAVRRSIKEFGA
jgi:hypothetical protein